MATAKTGKQDPKIPERYPRIAIDRSFSAEASRRNIDVIVWYKRLINATLGLLVASCIFTIIAVIFAFAQPMPELYGSSIDGGLRRLQYVRSSGDPNIKSMMQSLVAEDISRQALLDRQAQLTGAKSVLGSAPAQAPVAIPAPQPVQPNPSAAPVAAPVQAQPAGSVQSGERK